MVFKFKLESIGYVDYVLFDSSNFVCFDVLLGGFFYIQKGTMWTTCQFIWKLHNLPNCLRDGIEMWNLSWLYLIRSIATWLSQKVSLLLFFFLSVSLYSLLSMLGNFFSHFLSCILVFFWVKHGWNFCFLAISYGGVALIEFYIFLQSDMLSLFIRPAKFTLDTSFARD